MTVIRPAKPEDAPKLVEMGERFFNASGMGELTTFRTDVFLSALNHLYTNGILLIADENGPVGMAAALVYPFYFSGDLAAQEAFWWVDEEHRGIGSALLDALISTAQARGAQSLTMIALDSLDPEKVGGMYERRGFKKLEHSYIKKI